MRHRRARMQSALTRPSLVGSADVAAVARVDADDVTALDEERNLHGGAGLELRGLRRIRRRIAAKAGVGLDDLQFDVSRQIDADRRSIVKLHVDHHAVLEKVGGSADEIALQRYVLERLLVHEVKAVGVVVEHLHLPVVDNGALEFLAGAKGSLEGRAGLDVLQARSDEGRPLSRLHVKKLDDGPEVAVHDNGHAVTKVV